MSRTRVCFLEGLPTITAIVEEFGGVPSYNTPRNDFVSVTSFSLYHHKSQQYESDTMDDAEDIVIQSYCVTC